jgi:hydroxyacylglutathione hydrolase
MALPDDTVVYCAHEYTQANAAFAMTVEPDNPALVARVEEIDRLRSAGRPTVPTSIGLEKATNPFLRAESESLQRVVGLSGQAAVDVFAETRRRKDNF